MCRCGSCDSWAGVLRMRMRMRMRVRMTKAECGKGRVAGSGKKNKARENEGEVLGGRMRKTKSRRKPRGSAELGRRLVVEWLCWWEAEPSASEWEVESRKERREGHGWWNVTVINSRFGGAWAGRDQDIRVSTLAQLPAPYRESNQRAYVTSCSARSRDEGRGAGTNSSFAPCPHCRWPRVGRRIFGRR